MQFVQLIVENTFTNSQATSKDLQLTVFDRVFAKLVNQGAPIGKVQPIYLIAGAQSKTLGILTLNKGGSYSFFPELPGNYDFDHMTFNRDLEKDKHHYTRVTTDGREKVLPISAEFLTNGMYHAATFIFNDYQLLKGVPKEIIYPTLEIKKLKEINDAFITSGNPEGSTLLNLDFVKGSFCMQIFLIPTNIDYSTMTFFLKPFQTTQPDFELENGTMSFNAIIPHEYQSDYVLGILAFFHKNDVNTTLQIVTSAKQQGFYSKIEMAKK
jgi:hypothetical protein